MIIATATAATVAAIPSSSSLSSTSSTSSSHSSNSSSDDVDLTSISSLHILERKREEALAPSPTDDDDDEQERANREDEEDRKYELKIGFASAGITRAEALLSSSASGSGHEKRDGGMASAAPNSVASARIHTRMKALANYLMNNFSGLRKRIAATNAGSVSDVSRMRHYMQRRSAPDGADRPKLNILSTRHSGSELRTTLSWEDLAQDFDSDDVMYSTPKSRKRGRSSDIFQDAELRELCHECDVHKNHVDEVVAMVLASFGTVEMDVLVLEELVPDNIVVFVGMLVFQSLECCRELVDLKVLPAFLRYVQERYRRDMPFHNAAHAADVLHSLFMMLSTTALGDKISGHNQVGALFAAVMHDIEHTGFTNDFLIKTNHEIARTYPTRAPMEAKHISLAIEAITHPTFNILGKMTAAQQDDVLTVVRETILATALCYQRELLDAVKAVSASEWAKVEMRDDEDVLPAPLQLLSLRCAMHVSDICQTMKPFAQHEKWVSRLTSEHYLQGLEDERIQARVSPAYCFEATYTRAEFLVCQTGFLEGMALPAVSTLNTIPWLNVEHLVTGVKRNIAAWALERDM